MVKYVIILLVILFTQGRSLSASEPEARIVGGQDVDIKEFPYSVQIYISNNFFCGGCIIRSNRVLTGAHCMYPAYVKLYKIMYGTSKLGDQSNVARVNGIIFHQLYKKSSIDYDVAILITSNMIMSEFATPIALPPFRYTLKADTLITVTGWGLLDENKDFSEKLQMIQVPVIGRTQCYPVFRITDRMFCAGYPKGEKDFCIGDSGSPAVVFDSNTQTEFLVGLASFGDGCARPGIPGVYSSVINMQEWITRIIGT